ncbi:MAG: acetyl-CoA carboxylase biotin carboxyl carrier protein [Phycisphaerales bacterium]|nr:MAG: acetyl-CoA carboxylase biotin carboxyl carrier protein [Phycisphaerales bacterium]
MLDIDRIRELVDMMVANDLVEISLRDGDVEVNLRRPTASVGDVAPVVTTRAASPNPAGEAGAVALPAEAPAADEPEVDHVEIKSPMVGTFYAAPDPDSPPFVQLGSTVNPSTVVCIVEAMKVFNEIKAELSGTIQKVLVKNEEPIEYGQPLFLVRP